MLLFDPKLLILGPAMLLYWVMQSNSQSKELIWVKVRIVRETLKALRVDGPANDFWVPKSVIHEFKFKNGQFHILIPIHYLP